MNETTPGGHDQSQPWPSLPEDLADRGARVTQEVDEDVVSGQEDREDRDVPDATTEFEVPTSSETPITDPGYYPPDPTYGRYGQPVYGQEDTEWGGQQTAWPGSQPASPW